MARDGCSHKVTKIEGCNSPASPMKSPEEEQKSGGQVPWGLIAAIIVFNVIGKIGDAIGPAMVASKPVQLLLLNSSNTHCILTSTSVAFLPWILITVGRRFCEDPLYFYVGWKYREAALGLLRDWCPDAADGYDKAEGMFRKNLYAAVALNPGATVCALAGASKMSPIAFFALNIGSTTAQLLFMRTVCQMMPDKLDYVLELISANVKILLLIMVAITLLGALPLLRSKKDESNKTEDQQLMKEETEEHRSTQHHCENDLGQSCKKIEDEQPEESEQKEAVAEQNHVQGGKRSRRKKNTNGKGKKPSTH